MEITVLERQLKKKKKESLKKIALQAKRYAKALKQERTCRIKETND